MAEPAWTDLGGGVHVRRSRAFQMNSTALLHDEHAVLVDPGVLPSELDDIASEVAAAAPRSLTLLFTHAHWDHVLGRPWWPGAATLAHDRFAAEVRRDAARIREEIERLCLSHGERWEKGFEPFAPQRAVSGLHFTKLGPWRLVLRDAAGHCESQLSVHLPDHRLLIAADMLSDIEPPILDGPPEPYRQTLEGLRPLAEGGAIETLVPGHGSVARGRDEAAARLRRDLEYLARLGSEVARAFREGLSLEATQERLAGMERPGADDEAARSAHLQNLAHAYRGVAAGIKARKGPGSRPARSRPSPPAGSVG